MQKLQDSVFSIVKTTGLSPAVFSFLEPAEDFADGTPLGGILNDTRHAWLALGNKFCVVDLGTGLKIAAHTFGNEHSSPPIITSVAELPTPLTANSKQLVISLDCGVVAGMICIFHVNGSQMLRTIETEEIVTTLVVCDGVPDGPFSCYDGVVMAGTKSGLVFVFDLDRTSLIEALKNISKGEDQLVFNESNPTHLTFLPLDNVDTIQMERDLILEDDDHIAVYLNSNSIRADQYIFLNPDDTVRMKAKRGHVRVTALQYFPQLGSLAVGYNFGAFQIWNLITCNLEFTSQVNVECLPVTHFGFQEPCDDPRAFCYIWVVFSATDSEGEEEFPLAVMYSLTYLGKRMLSDTKCLYQDFSTATIRFQIELSSTDDMTHLIGGRCVSCHTYSVCSTLSSEGEDSMLNICQLVWECWGQHGTNIQHGMLLFDLDQWYKDQMPATYRLESNAFMSATCNTQLSRGATTILDVRLDPNTVTSYSHATRLEEHFYPNSLHYNCICLNTSEATTLSTTGIQRQIISSMEEVGPTCLLNPSRLYQACVCAGLAPLYVDVYSRASTQEEQRRFLLSVSLEAKLTRFLNRCAHDWATGSHAGAGCTLPFLVDWSWKRAIELKENAKELTAPLFTSSSLPDRNVVRCLEHCVQQLTHLTGLLDAILTKCCNLVVPDALSEMEEKYKGIGTVSLYFQVVQWFLRVGLLPERNEAYCALPYPSQHLYTTYGKRRLKLQRLGDNSALEEKPNKSCSLLYIDQLIKQEFGGDRIHQMWIRAGSECNGLYPPPSLYSLLRLYLLPDIPEEHKHSLVLYLLVDYSMLYDEVRYEAVIRRLMQFPTMFGLSNTAIKATQAFWHLDHRDFDFALDQLQCLTGNTLSDWQHKVVLSALLAQKKTQAALQYLHVRKPAPIQNLNGDSNNRVNDHDKLSDWESCCNLYLARALVYEALDVVRMCVKNASGLDEKVRVLKYFFRGCRNSGLLAKLLQVPLIPFEEEMFVKYLEECNDPQTSDVLVMFYLQQARYLEAEQYNNKLKQTRPRTKDTFTSMESLSNLNERENTREILVQAVCSALPNVANRVAKYVTEEKPATTTHIFAPKPMSVFIQAKSPKNTFTYKSSFIQDTIENASETWVNKPSTRKGIKRALNIQDTPFICTPKMNRTRSIFTEEQPSESTPPKRLRLDNLPATNTPQYTVFKVSQQLSVQMATLLDMPDLKSPDIMYDRGGADTPHSILKVRRMDASERMEAPSPVDSRYLCDSDEDIVETASNLTHLSDSKHLRFTIPTASESGTTPSPPTTAAVKEIDKASAKQSKMDIVAEYVAKTSHSMNESNPMESPPKKQATEEMIKCRKSYKDTVRARLSLSVSANSSLSTDPNTSIESIADIPVTLINPRYCGETRDQTQERDAAKTPKARRGIRIEGDRSRSCTPERQDSPINTSLRSRITRSRSRTPELSPRSSPLAPIPEQPKHEVDSEPHQNTTLLSVPRQLRSRSRTPERLDKVKTSPKLEVITESPTKSSTTESPLSPSRRSLRSRSHTPEIEIVEPVIQASPRRLRARSNTPEKLLSPKVEHSVRAKKSLSRIVLEQNAFAKSKQMDVKPEESTENVIECTPMKTLKPVTSLMDVTFSPIVNKSVLQSSNDSVIEGRERPNASAQNLGLKSLPAFTTINETYFDKSVLKSYQSSINETGDTNLHEKLDTSTTQDNKTMPAFNTINETGFKSVLHSYESSVAETSTIEDDGKTTTKTYRAFTSFSESIGKSVLGDSTKQSDLGESSKLEKFTSPSKYGECSKQFDAAKESSSLITNDSDVDMPEEEILAIHQDTNLIIRKTKQRIIETEKEEAEKAQKEFSDDSETDEEIIIGEEDSDSDDDDDDYGERSDSDGEVVEKIISIVDTDSDESITSNSESKSTTEHSSESNDSNERIIEIDDGASDKPDEVAKDGIVESAQDETVGLPKEEIFESAQVEIVELAQEEIAESAQEAIVGLPKGGIVKSAEVEMAKEKIVEIAKEVDEIEACKDPLAQGHNISLLTDDNSIHSDRSMNLNYSDDDKKISGAAAADVQIQVEVEKICPTEDVDMAQVQKEADSQKSIDVIDARTVENEPKDVDMATEIKYQETVKPAVRTRRAKSTSSNKSATEIEVSKTPRTRKRTQSTASNNSVERTPEKTPARSRPITPSSESRRILTRRASKELDKQEYSNLESTLLEELTPRRRVRKSKSIDDNASLVSDTSVCSSKPDVEVKAAPIRKGRKSISTKPDLSVIPEVTVDEMSSKMEDNSDIFNEYSSARRLTRNQKSVLESWLEAKPSPRRPASRTSVISEQDEDDMSSSSSQDQGDQSKGQSEGTPDAAEIREVAGSPVSTISDVSRQRRSRLGRAASETKTLPKARAIRRVSVDIATTPDLGSPVPEGSPARSRRASFNRACEALNTPKGRRTSTDLRKAETDSQPGSPATSEAEAPVTPSRRQRRISTQSNTSVKSDTGRRSKKNVDENKDTKKK